ncbi:uncharacterized protein V1516DRAFT_670310 [Lipomyces oligophaga]|uniref:uncharacterized protein n=1 Tax=Lipomyces oligophaga TaxID=45792 RepID=UPI0034CD9DBE
MPRPPRRRRLGRDTLAGDSEMLTKYAAGLSSSPPTDRSRSRHLLRSMVGDGDQTDNYIQKYEGPSSPQLMSTSDFSKTFGNLKEAKSSRSLQIASPSISSEDSQNADPFGFDKIKGITIAEMPFYSDRSDTSEQAEENAADQVSHQESYENQAVSLPSSPLTNPRQSPSDADRNESIVQSSAGENEPLRSLPTNTTSPLKRRDGRMQGLKRKDTITTAKLAELLPKRVRRRTRTKSVDSLVEIDSTDDERSDNMPAITRHRQPHKRARVRADKGKNGTYRKRRRGDHSDKSDEGEEEEQGSREEEEYYGNDTSDQRSRLATENKRIKAKFSSIDAWSLDEEFVRVDHSDSSQLTIPVAQLTSR